MKDDPDTGVNLDVAELDVTSQDGARKAAALRQDHRVLLENALRSNARIPCRYQEKT